MKKNLLVSKCLLGENVRYDGGNCLMSKHQLESLLESFNFIHICPEVMAGMTIPRIPIELVQDRVLTRDNTDVTEVFPHVLKKIKNLVQEKNITYALLKDFSPSCGSENVYDGSFSGRTIKGEGIVSKYLREAGVEVYHENNFEKLLKKLSV